MTLAICQVSKAPLRAQPADKAEMVSEVLFGEEVTILDRQGNWVAIKCNWDQYQGWMDPKQLMEIHAPISEKVVLTNPLENFITDLGPIWLSAGSELGLKESKFFLGDLEFPKPSNFPQEATPNTRKLLVKFGLQYLNVPYLWGGRSIFGIDCSGLTQICYKICGVAIPRDASQQAKIGEDVSFVENAQPGDLAFFENEQGKIIHVGIILVGHKILHASGKVRIDRLDHQGIFNEEIGKYTHTLRLIKSHFE